LSFAQAARRCHVTQPSLTRAIQLVEKEFEGRLFHRESISRGWQGSCSLRKHDGREMAGQRKYVSKARRSAGFAIKPRR
jgi:hypothetical protein